MLFDYTQQPGLKRWNTDYIQTAAPLVSLITPYFNGGRHLQQTCNAILDQTFPFFEWIIVNDGSTNPDDIALLDEIQKQDPRIRVLHKENGGISTARNMGIRNARTPYVVPIDSDDLLEPTFLEYCWWMLEKNPEAAWAYCDSLGFEGLEYQWHEPFDPIRLKTYNHLTHCGMIRKSAIDAIGGYCEKYKHFNEDWHCWLKLVADGQYPVQSQGEALMWYRRQDTGIRALVERDREIAENNRRLIGEVADQIKDPHYPTIYPKFFDCQWVSPHFTNWTKSIYRKKSKPHAAFLLPFLELGGADKFNIDLLRGLTEKGWDVGVLTTVQGENPWQQRFRAITPHIFNLPNFSDPRNWAEFVSYYIISRQVDVLFLSNSYHGYYLLPWLREHFPDLVIVDYVHIDEFYWRDGGYARTSAMLGGITERTYVCNTPTGKALTQRFRRATESVEVVHIGADHLRFDRDKVPAGTLYQELNLPPQRPVVLFLCRLHPQKRPFLMLEIARRVARKLPEVAFAVVGNGPQENALRHRANVLGLQNTVYFMGERDDVRPYYRDAALTLVCSIKEGLSLSAYESCAMGVPIISADVGGQSDLVDESVGALIPCLQSEEKDWDSRRFPDEEIDAYVDAILRHLNDPALCAEKSLNCRRRIEEGFSIACMVEYFDTELHRLMSDSNAIEKRHQVAQALQLCSPMAAEFFAMEMQEESVEAIVNRALAAKPTPSSPAAPNGFIYRRKTVWDMIRITVEEDGFWGIFRRGPRWILRRIKRLFHR